MMNRFKTALILASVASSALIAPLAHAQTTPTINPPALNDGEAVLHGAGASSIQNLLPAELNCIGGNNQLGVFTSTTVAGTLVTIAEPTNLSTPAGTFNCSSQELQPNFEAKYLATGSGTGRTAWRSTSNQFGVGNPFEDQTVTGDEWNRIQFAFSDSPVSSGDLSTYNSVIRDSIGGPAVQFPKYVLPVAIAYNPQYGSKQTGTNTDDSPILVPLYFNVQSAKKILNVDAGGLPLNVTTYCKIFNGLIVNWNDPEITADNADTSLASSNDVPGRFESEGVPIRIVGRVDRSGTTDIFTRHLAAACNLVDLNEDDEVDAADVALNKFDTAAETLPYDRTDTTLPNFASVRPDTGLSPSSTATVSGTANSVSNTYWNGSGFATVSGGTPATPIVQSGKLNGVGLFIVAAGTGGVAAAINAAPDVVSPTQSTVEPNGKVVLNGKLGYVGADFIPPAPSANGLFAAALKGTPGAGDELEYLMPSAENAELAADSTRAPQTTSTGAYDSTDAGRGLTRDDPLDWYAALYSPSATLANPSEGYPITGTTQFLGYTCYKAGNLEAIQNFVGWNTNYVTRDYGNNDRTGVFTASGGDVAGSGLLPRSNIGVMPNRWRQAINSTFLSDPHSLGLQFAEAGTGTVCTGKSGR